jgi:hypothetical protein
VSDRNWSTVPGAGARPSFGGSCGSTGGCVEVEGAGVDDVLVGDGVALLFEGDGVGVGVAVDDGDVGETEGVLSARAVPTSPTDRAVATTQASAIECRRAGMK